MIRLFRWFWRGLRARADRVDAAWLAVDQDDEDAWLRVSTARTPHERLAAGKANHRGGLR
jgi:hypothetical protein